MVHRPHRTCDHRRWVQVSSIVTASLKYPLAPTVQLDLNLPACIPESYVPEAALRLQLYRRLAGLTALDAVDELAQEFADRFGPVPEDVANLLFIVQIKVLAINTDVEVIGFEEGQLLIKCTLPGDLGSERAARPAEGSGRAGTGGTAGHLAGDARGSRAGGTIWRRRWGRCSRPAVETVGWHNAPPMTPSLPTPTTNPISVPMNAAANPMIKP